MMAWMNNLWFLLLFVHWCWFSIMLWQTWNVSFKVTAWISYDKTRLGPALMLSLHISLRECCKLLFRVFFFSLPTYIRMMHHLSNRKQIWIIVEKLSPIKCCCKVQIQRQSIVQWQMVCDLLSSFILFASSSFCSSLGTEV